MENDELARILGEMRFTDTMSPATLDRLAEIADLETHPANTVVFREGGLSPYLHLVWQGKVALEIHVPGRGRRTILTVGRGEFFGWSGLLEEGKMTATAVAVEDTQVVRASSTQLNALCEQDYEFGYHLMRGMALALSRRLVSTRLQLLDLFADEHV